MHRRPPHPAEQPGAPDARRRAGRRLLAGMLWAVLLGVAVLQASPVAAADARPVQGVWPLEPRPPVVARFDPPRTPWGRGHRGVDLAGRVGQQVHAAAAGVVTYAGRLAGRGVVVVDHGATRTTYEPVAANVHVGDRLAAGAAIGRLQLFGSHCFPRACLHWGLIQGRDHYLDPLSLVGAAPVRLLPLGGSLRLLPGGPVLPMPAVPVGPGTPVLPSVPRVPGAPSSRAAAPPSGPPAAAAAMTGAVLEPVLVLAASGSRVGLAVGRAQPLARHVRVDLGGRR